VDDHLHLPGVADVRGGVVVTDRLDALEQARPELGAVGESVPLRVDVVVDAVPANREVWFVDVKAIGECDA
jgi:hypothetical protein